MTPSTTITTRAAAAAAFLLAALALILPLRAEAAVQRLSGSVGPGFTITLKTAAGAKVTTLKAGTYTIVVRDRSAQHNFQLRGPGLNRVLSGVAFTGTKTVTVRLRAGKYGFVCEPHAGVMHGSFRVR